MVDALRRAHRWLRPDGRLIDLRPTSDLVVPVDVGGADTGWARAGTLTVQDSRRDRYAAADRALRGAVDDGWFAIASEQTFEFLRYADSADELRDDIASKWRETRMGPETHARAVDLQRARRAPHVRLGERMVIRALQRLGA